MQTSASDAFSEALGHIARRGWFSSWPSADDGMSVLYASFRIHPEDAERVFAVLESATQLYGGETRWVVHRHNEDHFVLFPEELRAFDKTGNLSAAALSLREAHPSLERQAAMDLCHLTHFLYAKHA